MWRLNDGMLCVMTENIAPKVLYKKSVIGAKLSLIIGVFIFSGA